MQPAITLSDKQKYAFDLMNNTESILLTGPAGSGKSAVVKLFIRANIHDRRVVMTSTTGASAVLVGGVTLHSYLSIGYGKGTVKELVTRILAAREGKRRWRELECLIIDEVSMLDPVLFDKLEEIGRILRNNCEPFGGIQLILAGDFLQLPCVGTDKFCFQAKSWDRCIKHVVYFDKLFRQDDLAFQDCLNDIRLGNITQTVKRTLNSRIGAELTNEYNIKPTRLFAKNVDVDRINDNELDKLAEEGREFYEHEMTFDIPIGFGNVSTIIEKFKKNTNFMDKIQICLGAQVILIANLDVENGLANGSRGVIIAITNSGYPVVQFLNGLTKTMAKFPSEVDKIGNKVLMAHQLPLKIAYALTIHRSQGCSLDYVEIDLSEIFEYGQGYVALSRARTLEGLSIVGDITFGAIQAHPKALDFYRSLE